MNRIVTLLLSCAIGGTALAQRYNVDVGLNVNYPVPSASFAGAAGSPGVWNAVDGGAGTTALVDTTGASLGVTLTSSGGGNFESNIHPGPPPGSDDEKFLRDISDPGTSPRTWTFSGLPAGNYLLYTYAWAPDDVSNPTLISVAGSSDPAHDVYGDWLGGYSNNFMYALHRVTVTAGGSIAMTISIPQTGGYGSLNGFQIVPNAAASTSFCEPAVSGVMLCQCNNNAGYGLGCMNSSQIVGANLLASGYASLALDATDPGSVILTGNSMFHGSLGVFLQGDAFLAGGTTFGAGIRCVNGNLQRLKTAAISGGFASYPLPTDPSISNRSTALGAPITAGAMRWYQVYYRDPTLPNPGGNCPAIATFNITNAQRITWTP